jgi:long-chain acyl-CoA synthetase
MTSPEGQSVLSPVLSGAALEPFERSTLTATFLGAVDRFDTLPAQRWWNGTRWSQRSYHEALDEVARAAAWLIDRGVAAGDRVAILSENRPEWALFDYAILCLGAATVPVYPSLPADQVAHILEDAGACGVLVDTAAQREKVERAGAGSVDWVTTFERVGRLEPVDLRAIASAVSPDHLATVVYSSGTTGPPKGVMLSHGNLAYMVAATAQHGSVPAGPGDSCLSILPLSHVLERAAAYYFWDQGVTIAYARSIDTLAEDLATVRPHVMVSVPRLFEKLHARVMDASGVRGRLGRWADGVARDVVDREAVGAEPTLWDRLKETAARLTVFSTLRRRTGGRLRGFISGGAPLSPAVAPLFIAAGMPIYEGYGLTETSPVLTANRPGALRLGTVGVPYPGVDVRIADNGEILARGPGIMQGYWNAPEATAESIDGEGWFHTGDVGRIDAGFLRITDRLKDLIVTAGGKNIAPQPVESEVMRSPYVAQAVMVGDRRAFPAVLVVPDWEAVDRWAAEQGLDLSEREAATRDPRLLELLHDETVDRVRDFARHETPRRLSLLPEEFTVESGLLTPTLKARRRAIEQRFHGAIEKLYAEIDNVREEVRNLRHGHDGGPD